MDSVTVKEMCWLSSNLNDRTKILHVRNNKQDPWRPYHSVPGCNIRDYQIPGGSKGWAAMQYLMKNGWVLLPSPKDNEGLSIPTHD
jgi:hypothetical protein